MTSSPTMSTRLSSLRVSTLIAAVSSARAAAVAASAAAWHARSASVARRRAAASHGDDALAFLGFAVRSACSTCQSGVRAVAVGSAAGRERRRGPESSASARRPLAGRRRRRPGRSCGAGARQVEQVLDPVRHLLHRGQAQRAGVALDRVERPEHVVQQRASPGRCRAPAALPQSCRGDRAPRR